MVQMFTSQWRVETRCKISNLHLMRNATAGSNLGLEHAKHNTKLFSVLAER